MSRGLLYVPSFGMILSRRFNLAVLVGMLSWYNPGLLVRSLSSLFNCSQGVFVLPRDVSCTFRERVLSSDAVDSGEL